MSWLKVVVPLCLLAMLIKFLEPSLLLRAVQRVTYAQYAIIIIAQNALFPLLAGWLIGRRSGNLRAAALAGLAVQVAMSVVMPGLLWLLLAINAPASTTFELSWRMLAGLLFWLVQALVFGIAGGWLGSLRRLRHAT